jgi:hypothetical protein
VSKDSYSGIWAIYIHVTDGESFVYKPAVVGPEGHAAVKCWEVKPDQLGLYQQIGENVFDAAQIAKVKEIINETKMEDDMEDGGWVQSVLASCTNAGIISMKK